MGELRRADVTDRFGKGPAAATRDIALYRKIAPENLTLDNSDKVYRPSPEFVPLLDHSPARVLTALSQGFGEGHGEQFEAMVRCEIPITLSLPKMSVLAPPGQSDKSRQSRTKPATPQWRVARLSANSFLWRSWTLEIGGIYEPSTDFEGSFETSSQLEWITLYFSKTA